MGEAKYERPAIDDAGYCSATSAAGLGWIEGDAQALAAVDGVFVGNGPWMADRF